MIKYHQLLHARALLLHENFRKAANEVNISQPAFSRSIANLEDTLGVQLFNRQRGKVTPTPFGEVLRKHSSLIINSTLELEREIEIVKDVGEGELHVALAPYPSEISGHYALGKLIAQHPKIRCSASVSDWNNVEKLVLERKTDLGFAEISQARNNKKLVTELIGEHQFVFFCRSGHPLTQKKQVLKEDLFNLPIVSIRLPNRISPFFPGKMFSAKDSTHMLPSVEIYDLASSRQIVMESDACSACAPIQIQHELETDKLSIIPFHEPWMKLNYGFMYDRERLLSPVAMKYMSLVKEVEKNAALRNKKIIEAYVKR